MTLDSSQRSVWKSATTIRVGAALLVFFSLSFSLPIPNCATNALALAQDVDPTDEQSERVTLRKLALDLDTHEAMSAKPSDDADASSDPLTLDLPTPRQVVDKHILACGGHEILSSISTLQMFWEGDGITVETYSQHGEIAIKFLSDGETYLERRVTGDVVWMISRGAPSVMTGKSRKEYLRRSKFLPPDDWFVNSSNAKVVGIVEIDGKKTYQLNYLSDDDVKTDKFFDVETGLLARTKKMEYTLSNVGELTTRDSLEYQWFGEIYYPVVSKVTTGTNVTAYRLVDMVANEEIDEDHFTVSDEIQTFLSVQQRLQEQRDGNLLVDENPFADK